VYDDETVESLSVRILVEEHRLYPEAIHLVLDATHELSGRRFLPRK
jgi:phosphoribosylglycinamide formyltransferase 1